MTYADDDLPAAGPATGGVSYMARGCWRIVEVVGWNEDAGKRFCGRMSVGIAGLCEEHRTELQEERDVIGQRDEAVSVGGR